MTGSEIPLFDPIIHPPHRLRICAALQPWDEYEFAGLRDVIGVSDSVLSKQLALLQAAGYVLLRRATRSGRQRVWVMLTDRGRDAFTGHVAALRDIVEQSPLSPTTDNGTAADRTDLPASAAPSNSVPAGRP